MKKGLLLINNKVEDVEALATRALLVRAGYDVTTFTLEKELKIKTAFGLEVIADKLVNEINIKEYDFLVLPGGSHVFNWINDCEKLNNIIHYFNQQEKLIAAICAAPLFLGKLGLLSQCKYTAFPSVTEQIEGEYVGDAKTVLDRHLITARSAGAVYDFVFEIVKYFDGNIKVEELRKNIIY